MPILSGKDGTVLIDDVEVAQLTRWTLRRTSRNKAYTANDTGGAWKRTTGSKDATGRFLVQVTDSGSAPVEEGDAVTLELHVDDTDENYYRVPAVIDSVGTEVDVDRGELVGYRVGFSGNGPITAFGVLAKSSTSSSGFG